MGVCGYLVVMFAARAPQPRGVAGDGDAPAQHAEGQRAARARPPPRLATASHRHEHCAVAGIFHFHHIELRFPALILMWGAALVLFKYFFPGKMSS